MIFIWASRGRTWGFKFLSDAGFVDPLPAYDWAFAHAGDEPEACHLIGGTVALRFPDPLGRCDVSGRIIPHEFVIFGELAQQICSVEVGRELIWPLVVDKYEQVWNLANGALAKWLDRETDDSGVTPVEDIDRDTL